MTFERTWVLLFALLPVAWVLAITKTVGESHGDRGADRPQRDACLRFLVPATEGR